METLKKRETKYAALRTEPQYLKLLLAEAANRFGDAIDQIVFAYIALEISGSAAWFAALMGFNFLPTVLIGPFAGVLVERMNLKWLMALADIGRVLLVMICAVLYFTGLLQLWMLVVITMSISTFEVFRVPAAQSVRMRLLPKEKFSIAIGANQVIHGVAQLAGLGIAGVLVSIHTAAALSVDLALFLLSALMILAMRGDFSTKITEKLSMRSYFSEFAGGMRYLGKKKALIFLCVFGAGMNFFFAPLSALSTPYIVDTLSLAPWALSLFGICFAVSTVIGSGLAPKLRKQINFRRAALLSGIFTAIGSVAYALLPRLALGVLPTAVLLGVITFVCLMPVGFIQVNFSSMFMENLDKEYVARVSGTFSAITLCMSPIGSFVCAGLAKVFSIPTIFLMMALPILIFFSMAYLPKSIRELDK